jgi:hypothetical protein
LSDDHVPPQNLFPKPRPNDLITVPACSDCHSSTSKDDEYFRIKICFRNDAGNHPGARANWGSILRSLNREQAKGFRKQILSDFRYVQLKTSSGLYIGKRNGYNVELSRIRGVVERTVRGLYFAESGNPLGLNNEVRVYSNEDLEEQPQDVIDQFKQTILIPLAAYPPKVIGNNVFLYRHHIVKENPLFSIWGVSFYGQVPFLAMTGPRDLTL